MVYDFAADLLWGHVAGSAGSDADNAFRRWDLVNGSVGQPEFGETEVEDLYSSVASEEQVLGFKVAMTNGFLMSGRESESDLARVVGSLAPM